MHIWPKKYNKNTGRQTFKVNSKTKRSWKLTTSNAINVSNEWKHLLYAWPGASTNSIRSPVTADDAVWVLIIVEDCADSC